MALDDRADVVTVDDGDLDGRGEPAEAANGAPLSEAALAEDNDVPVPDDTSGTNGGRESRSARTTRPGRKRTARQRALLVAGDAGTEGASTTNGDAPAHDDEVTSEETESPSPVDPLLAGSATDAGDDQWSPDHAGTTTIPPGATAAAAVVLPSEPPPTTAVPALNGQPETQVLEPVPSSPATVVPPPPRPRRRARPRVRKVTRIVRSVDAWSVFKVALIFFLAMGVVLITAGVLLWNLAQSTGTLDNVEGFFREAFGYDTFELQSEPLFRAGLTLTALFVVAGTGLTVVMAVLFNLIADLTGGIRLTVLEREVIAREDVVRRRRRRRLVPRPVPKPAVKPVSDLPAPPPLDAPRPANG